MLYAITLEGNRAGHAVLPDDLGDHGGLMMVSWFAKRIQICLSIVCLYVFLYGKCSELGMNSAFY